MLTNMPSFSLPSCHAHSHSQFPFQLALGFFEFCVHEGSAMAYQQWHYVSLPPLEIILLIHPNNIYVFDSGVTANG